MRNRGIGEIFGAHQSLDDAQRGVVGDGGDGVGQRRVLGADHGPVGHGAGGVSRQGIGCSRKGKVARSTQKAADVEAHLGFKSLNVRKAGDSPTPM